MSSEPRLITPQFGVLVVAHFLQALGYASLLLLPLYLDHLQASRTEIGAIMSTASVSGLCTRPIVAWALDRGGRKPTLVVGTIVLSASMVMIAAIDDLGPLIYLERALVGIGIGALFSAYFTFAADLVPTARRTEGLALFGISGLVPLLVNPLSSRLDIAPAELRWFLPAVGALIALSLVPIAFLREPRGQARGHARPMREALGALTARPLWPVWLATVAFAGLVAVFMTFATVAAKHRDIADAPSLWLSYALGAVSVRALGARLPDRVGPANMVAPALGVYLCALLVAAEATTFRGFLLAALLAGLGHGYCFPVLTGQVVTRAPEAFRGSAIAAFTALWGLSELLVAPAFGAVADAQGDAVMFYTAAAGGIASLVAWLVLEHRFGARRPQTEP